MTATTNSMLVRAALIGTAFAAMGASSACAPKWEYATAWCARLTSGVNDCAYYTIEQCRATVSGEGGDCVPNPRFTPGREGPRQRRKAG